MKIVLLFVLISIAILKSYTINAKVAPVNGKDLDQISLLDSDQKLNITSNNKPILRYGFQQTQECKVFDKAFLCIRKCLDLGFQLAHTDKKCTCTCKHNREIAMYKTPSVSLTKWKVGAPTTRLPSWFLKHTPKIGAKDSASALNDYEIYADIPIPDAADIKQLNAAVTKPSAYTDNSNTSNLPEEAEVFKGDKNEEQSTTNPSAGEKKELNENSPKNIMSNNTEVSTNATVESTITNDTNYTKQEDKKGVTESGKEGVKEEGKTWVTEAGVETVTGEVIGVVTEKGKEGVTEEGKETTVKTGRGAATEGVKE